DGREDARRRQGRALLREHRRRPRRRRHQQAVRARLGIELHVPLERTGEVIAAKTPLPLRRRGACRTRARLRTPPSSGVPMSTRTCTGSCDCGNVRFEADLDLDAGGGKCNCSICRKTRNWSASVKPEAFRLLEGAGEVVDYQFGTGSVHWPFCRRCGVRAYGHGDIPEAGGRFYSVRLNCLDDVPAEALAAMPVSYANGRDNDWWHEPGEAEQRWRGRPKEARRCLLRNRSSTSGATPAPRNGPRATTPPTPASATVAATPTGAGRGANWS